MCSALKYTFVYFYTCKFENNQITCFNLRAWKSWANISYPILNHVWACDSVTINGVKIIALLNLSISTLNTTLPPPPLSYPYRSTTTTAISHSPTHQIWSLARLQNNPGLKSVSDCSSVIYIPFYPI